MEKFTRLFLLGEHSIARVLRKIGLGLALVLWTTFAFGQLTYQVKVASWDSCYQTDNVYSVPVTMKDFVKIKKFVYELKYTNTADFNFLGLTNVHDSISTMVTVQDPDGTLTFTWEKTRPVTISGGAEAVLFKLNFQIAGFQHQYLNANKFAFGSVLTWTKTDLFNDVGQCEILSSNIINGAINITEKWQSVVLDYAVAKCAGQYVTATVTTPAHVSGMLYSFNGQSYTSTNKTEVYAPSADNQLTIKDGTCISYIKKFDVTNIAPLEFDVETPVYAICPGGLGDIEILASKGTPPYTYYVVPEVQWIAGDLMEDKLGVGDVSLLSKYTYANYVVQAPAGSVASPTYYWVAVQDANGCAAITGTNLLSWWKRVAVIDDKTPILATPTPNQDLMTTCFGQPDGRINFVISGGTPFKKGYNISLGGIYLGRNDSVDSNVWVDCDEVPCSHAVLAPGCYEYTIVDSLGCSKLVKYCVEEPDKIVFNVDHTDAGCDSPVGQLWISSVVESSGSGTTPTWRWHYSTDPTFPARTASNTETSDWMSLTTIATNLPQGVYYVEVEDGNGCAQMWSNAAGDNAIKILTTVFDIVYTPIKCNGGTTSVQIVLVSGDANHTFQYMVEKQVCEGSGETASCTWQIVGTGWQSANTFTGILGGVKYRYSVKDVTAFNCVISWEKILTQPAPLVATPLTGLIVYPSCPGNMDGNIAISVSGGTPFTGNMYKYQIDNRPATYSSFTNDFAVGAGTYTITITDANTCSSTVAFNIPNGRDFINFENKINVACAKDSVNLFNSLADNDNLADHVGLDKGYLLDYEWYPEINHTSDGADALKVLFWTSADGWKEVAIQGNFRDRNPKLYISNKPWVVKSDIVINGQIVKHDSKFGAGTYFVVAKDEWGCLSNVDTIKVIEPLPLRVVATTIAAGCADTWTGSIKVEAFNGKFDIPTEGLQRYQYVLVQQPDIFNYPNWYGTQVTWKDFRYNNSLTNDSVLLIAVQKGTYWLAIRDYCSIHDPSQIQYVGPLVIDGKDPISANVAKTNVDCFGNATGAIFVTGAAGGFGGYTYEIQWVDKPSGTTGWPKTTSSVTGLKAGTYHVKVKDSEGCTPFEKDVVITQPTKLVLALTGVDASCFGAQDGIIRYTITGGTSPYQESTNNGANWYEVVGTTVTSTVTTTFDRRAGAGTYIVWLQDANGCVAKDTIVIAQPVKLAISSVVVTNVSCPPAQAVNCKFTNVINDGQIKVNFTGGWNAADAFRYYVTATKGTDVRTLNADVTGFVTFTGLTAGVWTIKLWENAAEWYAKPYIMNPSYASAYAAGFPFTKQNSDNSVCNATLEVTVGAPNPMAYTVEYHPVLCRDTHSGEIHVHNVTGGTGPYWFMLEGPADNVPSISPESTGPNGVWMPAGDGVTEIQFKGLPYGIYSVFVKDSKGCVICVESGDVLNQNALTLMVSLVKNADCFDTATGQIKLEATSFPVGYTLKYAVALASDVEQYLFPLDDDNFVKSLTWQDSNIFNVKSGVWIGYVKAINAAGRMCGTELCYCIQGHSTDKNGTRILNHRVFVDQPTQVVGAVWDKFAVKALCHGDANGKIKVSSVSGGSGVGYSAHVFGTTFAGVAVDKFFSDVETGDLLEGLYASTDKTDTTKMVDSDYYKVVFIDSKGCLSPEYKVAVLQPDSFKIELVLKQDAFICPQDLAGVFEIRVVSGGTGTITYKYEAWDGTTKVLSSPYGAINTFQGPAGLLYKGWAKDANNCEAYAEKFVAKPITATFDVLDRTCYGDGTASAIVKLLVKDPARMYMVSYLKFDDAHVGTWSPWSAEFGDSIKITGLTYGDFSTDLGHYRFKIKDTKGCESAEKLITFEPVQSQLKTCCATVVPGECTGTLSITITGGITPYTVFIDGKAMTGASWVLPSGAHHIKVIDKHLCVSEMDVTIDPNPVSRTASAVAFVGEKVKFTDTEAKLDTMLAKGVYTFTYKFTPDTCVRTLVVTVTEQYRVATIAEAQGTGDVSPLKDLPRQISGTVTAVVPGIGYYMQDGRDAVNGRTGIFVKDPTTVVLENTGVKVSGIVKEENDVTTLVASLVEFVSGTVYAPIVLASPADGKNEKWESVLVQVVGARFQGSVNPDGSWLIKTTETSTILVNDYMFAYVPVDGHYYTVTGIINGANSLYKLEPRKAADVIDLTKTTPVLDIDNLQFKVYPNPFNDYLNIDNSDRLSRVTITNIAGQRVMDIQYPERVIRTSNLVSGVYVITLFTEEGIAKSERMVKR